MSIDLDLVKKRLVALEEKKRKTLQTKEQYLKQKLREKWTDEGVTPEVLRSETGYQSYCTGTDLPQVLSEGVREPNEIPAPDPIEERKRLLRQKWAEVVKSRS